MAFKHLAYIFFSVNPSSFYASLVILAICYYLYRVRKHMDVFPTAPGYPILGNLLDYAERKNVLQNLLEHTLRTGKILRMTVGPVKPTLFVVDRKMIEFTVTANRYLTKAKFYVFFKNWLGDGLVTSSGGAKWKSRRRALMASFSQSSILQNFIAVFEDQGNLLVKLLECEVGKGSVDLHPFMKRFTMDVICECALGVSIHSQENKNSEYAENVEMLQDIAVRRATSFFKRSDFFFRLTEEYRTEKRALRILDEFFDRILELKKKKIWDKEQHFKEAPQAQSNNKHQAEATPPAVLANQAKFKAKPQAEGTPQTQFDTHAKSKTKPQAALDIQAGYRTKPQAKETAPATLVTQANSKTKRQAEETPQAVLEDKVQSKTKPQAVLDLLLNLEVDGKPMTRDDLREEINTIIFAGYDTTATAISYTLYAVAKYPEIQDKIYEEQRKIFGGDIKKSKTTYEDIGKMDYLSLVIKESLRMYPPIPFIANRVSKDLKYNDDIILPEGLNIGKFIYGIHHNPDYFHDPEEFIPERFKDESLLPYIYMPFSLGPRQCIGKRFALLEIKCTLSKIFRNYRVHPVPGHSLQLVPTMSLISDTGIRVSLEKL